jgi:RNA polymerase sigma-70 factor (ECF subfamily)
MEVHDISDDPQRSRPDLLVERARAGALDAFEQLYQRHAGRVYALCLRMTGEPSRAEDLTQEVFIRAWRKLGSFRGEGGFAGWLRRLTINVVLMEIRARRRRRDRVQPGEKVLEFEKPLAPRQLGAGLDLETAIGGLPPRARSVFVLHDVEGYNHEEIARIMNVAVGTSKAQLHRARRMLREALRR